jgi:formylmethanofuran dehydrogenase subunit E
MNAAEKLYQEYQQRLTRLQQECPHSEQTDWMEEWSAPEHSTDRKVKLCANCDRVMEARRRCDGCGKEFPEEQLQQGDGRTRPWGSGYCAQCYLLGYAARTEG